MGYLAETVAGARLAERLPARMGHVALWHETTMAEWLVSIPGSFVAQRLAMIAAIRQRLAALSDRLDQRDIEQALTAMAAVPREAFVCPLIDDLAYLPMALAIGLDQIISHPELAAVLAAAVAPAVTSGGGHVLDVGTGSGYQAAVLAQMADRVTSIEIFAGLGTLARARLDRLDYANIEVVTGDAGAPGMFATESFSAIVVAAGAATVPPELLAALKVGGRLVMPLGATADEEQLVLIERIAADRWRRTRLRPVKFVPLTGRGARCAPVY